MKNFVRIALAIMLIITFSAAVKAAELEYNPPVSKHMAWLNTSKSVPNHSVIQKVLHTCGLMCNGKAQYGRACQDNESCKCFCSNAGTAVCSCCNSGGQC